MRGIRGLVNLMASLALSLACASASELTGPLKTVPDGRQLVLTFSDDFNSLKLWNGTSGTWSTQYWYNAAANGGSQNDELEWYLNPGYPPTSEVKTLTVNDGVLSLTAARASPSIQPLINNHQYTSGMITTEHSFSQLYGYFEIRAKLPAGKGLWPAFWLLPTDRSWPPEIDVLEVLGDNTRKLYTSVHYGKENTSHGVDTTVPDMSADFHTYAVLWEPDSITWYFDGRQVFRNPTPPDMNKPMYILANLGVG